MVMSAPSVDGAECVLVKWSDLPHWEDDDHLAAYQSFLETARAIYEGRAPLRAARDGDHNFRKLASHALTLNIQTRDHARKFFETYFEPYAVKPHHGHGFLTAYYEPVVEASFEKNEIYSVPLYAKPDDLRENYFTRAEIENGALAGRGLELLYLKNPVDLFFMQVQGSGKAQLPDGTLRRIQYAGRNGQPYVTIAKVLIAEGHLTLAEAHAEGVKRWLKAHPDEAQRIMRMNTSYIFFDVLPDAGEKGPVGGAASHLIPHRSIAIDRTIWPYGLPFYIAAELPDGRGGLEFMARLMIAQDTGSAILGPARADLFMGSGDEAGYRAGLIRHRGDFIVLWPKGDV
jgi:membrane-bound lytic murein transglycosylase A